jgi:hypothetical protein
MFILAVVRLTATGRRSSTVITVQKMIAKSSRRLARRAYSLSIPSFCGRIRPM